jgi:hypothetical protein
LLKVQIAFVVLGIGLAGLCPFVVMQLRQVRVLEERLQGQVERINTATGTGQVMLQAKTYYLVPWQNPWARKIAGSAQVLESATNACDPGSLPLPVPPPASFPVIIRTLSAPSGSQSVTVSVDVSAP